MSGRVLILSQWFDPEPTLKGLVFARELVRRGYQVEVVTGFPNYPGGKIYPGYRMKLLQRETIDGVEVTRLPLFPSHDQSALKRILNYATFAFSALIYGLFGARKADVIYAYHPPLTVGVVAGLLRIFRRIPVVYDIQDMWPDTLRATGMLSNKFALGVVGAVCNWVYRRVDQIVVLSPGFKKMLCERGVPESKIEVIYNWADEVQLRAPTVALADDLLSPDRFRILFAGNQGKAQALDSVLDSAALLQSRCPKAQFIMLGGGVESQRLKVRADEMGLSNVLFLPPVPMQEVGAYLSAADVLLVHLRKDHLFSITIPSKTQAYMAVSKPILMAVNGDAADLVRQSGGGIVAESEDPHSLAEAVEKFAMMSPDELAHLAAQSGKFYKKNLSLEAGVDRFSTLFGRFGNTQPVAS